jgi:hypothetical protein
MLSSYKGKHTINIHQQKLYAEFLQVNSQLDLAGKLLSQPDKISSVRLPMYNIKEHMRQILMHARIFIRNVNGVTGPHYEAQDRSNHNNTSFSYVCVVQPY